MPGGGALNATLLGQANRLRTSSTRSQNLAAQRTVLTAAGVHPESVYTDTDHGYTSTRRDARVCIRPWPREGRGHSRGTKLDRLARSLPDAKDITDELTRKTVTLNVIGVRRL
ncbi:recombinase family protein [Sinomonas sp. G460-2]|uniref:recombinase family protein n=1 Tax=Sinomonas sp. G460-2 TaxID=3393464 RepID=UPI0039EFFB71